MGLVYLFTGDGKGKTTAAFGMAIRYLGHGKNVVVVQFMKKRPTGEVKFLESLNLKNLEIKRFGREVFVDLKKPDPEDVELAKEAIDYAKKVLLEKEPDLLLLDEVNVAIAANLITKDDIMEIIDNLPEKTDLVLTGRWAKKYLIDKADLVTEMLEIKHPYQKGIPAREGPDF